VPMIRVLTGVLLCMVTTQSGFADNSLIKVEIRGNENSSIVYGEHMHNNLHFITTSQTASARVFQEWNSWGWEARSFSARDFYDSKKEYRIFRRAGPWTKNFPAFHSIEKSKFIITDINLIDRTWKIEPSLAEGQAHRLILTGHLEIKLTPEAIAGKVWTGRVSTGPQEVVIQKEVTPILNKK
jgi:hypothetical protein